MTHKKASFTGLMKQGG